MKFKIINIFIVLFILSGFTSEAQRWKRTRYELIYGVGTNSVFGEIGGGSGKGGNIATSIKDFDIQTLLPSAAVGFRYRVTEQFAVKANLIYGLMGANDKYSKDEQRRDRGISFLSTIFEQSMQFEYSIVKERLGRRYTLSNIKGLKNLHINTYVIAGIGGVSFNPTLKINGLSDTIPNTAVVTNYSKYAMVIPIGIGFKYGINRKLSLAIEYANRFCFTDYLDGFKDVNSRSSDSYMFMTFSISYKLRTTRNGWPKF